ncbi:Uncharacterised protein [Shigella sonnei]|nr:Uncharacterised protein [Shigella sonnei]CSP93980.1 Uncharacterised protein [Shigella sonnei]CSQ04127.1 Uncharacterised protein [Shigella sonnei]CST19433.1 Uncharacterised protein [Shigella sonnei]
MYRLVHYLFALIDIFLWRIQDTGISKWTQAFAEIHLIIDFVKRHPVLYFFFIAREDR